jgi:hypothetical protein
VETIFQKFVQKFSSGNRPVLGKKPVKRLGSIGPIDSCTHPPFDFLGKAFASQAS